MKEGAEERGQRGEATYIDSLMALKWHLFLRVQLVNVPVMSSFSI